VVSLALAALGLLALGFVYGALLKVSDLLQEHGYRWANRAHGDLLAGVLCAGAGVGLLALSGADARVFWVAVILSWLLRGRIDGMNHGVMAFAMGLYALVTLPSGWALGPRFWYFLVPLAVLGVLHDLFQYTSLQAPKPVLWFFEMQHLYWYLLVAGYLVLFERDWVFAASVYGFVKGYGFFYAEHRRAWLGRVQIRPAAPP
jgi:hypothetical protein